MGVNLPACGGQVISLAYATPWQHSVRHPHPQSLLTPSANNTHSSVSGVGHLPPPYLRFRPAIRGAPQDGEDDAHELVVQAGQRRGRHRWCRPVGAALSTALPQGCHRSLGIARGAAGQATSVCPGVRGSVVGGTTRAADAGAGRARGRRCPAAPRLSWPAAARRVSGPV